MKNVPVVERVTSLRRQCLAGHILPCMNDVLCVIRNIRLNPAFFYAECLLAMPFLWQN